MFCKLWVATQKWFARIFERVASCGRAEGEWEDTCLFQQGKGWGELHSQAGGTGLVPVFMGVGQLGDTPTTPRVSAAAPVQGSGDVTGLPFSFLQPMLGPDLVCLACWCPHEPEPLELLHLLHSSPSRTGQLRALPGGLGGKGDVGWK